MRSGKKVFFYEDLNLKGLTKRNKVKQDETRKFIPNGQSAKSGLNKSWMDAAFGNFFKTLDYIAEKAGAVVIQQKPAYSSMILCYRNEVIFTDCRIRDYWDEKLSLMVDRDINAAINLKRLGLGIFPSIKRRSGKIDIVGSMSNSITKEILNTLIGLKVRPRCTASVSVGSMSQDWKPAVDKIPDLAEKVGELKNWRQFLIITVTATVSGVLGWFLRGGNLKP